MVDEVATASIATLTAEPGKHTHHTVSPHPITSIGLLSVTTQVDPSLLALDLISHGPPPHVGERAIPLTTRIEGSTNQAVSPLSVSTHGSHSVKSTQSPHSTHSTDGPHSVMSTHPPHSAHSTHPVHTPHSTHGSQSEMLTNPSQIVVQCPETLTYFTGLCYTAIDVIPPILQTNSAHRWHSVEENIEDATATVEKRVMTLFSRPGRPWGLSERDLHSTAPVGKVASVPHILPTDEWHGHHPRPSPTDVQISTLPVPTSETSIPHLIPTDE